jgi:hypothetical protein
MPNMQERIIARLRATIADTPPPPTPPAPHPRDLQITDGGRDGELLQVESNSRRIETVYLTANFKNIIRARISCNIFSA